MLWLLLACTTTTPKLIEPGENGGVTEPPPPPAYAVALAGPDCLDPLLAPTLTSTLTSAEGDAVRVEILDAAGAVVATLADGTTLVDSVTWDGLDSLGAVAAVGDYVERATLLAEGTEVATTERPVHVVRVGILDGTLGGEDRVSLIWHRAGRDGQYFEAGEQTLTFSVAAIDDGVTATPLPMPWADLDAPPKEPVGVNLPAAYPFDAVPTLTLTRAGDPAGADVSVAIDGWTCADNGDSTTTCTSDGPLANTVGVVETTLAARWTTAAGTFAEQAIPLRIYALYDRPGFEKTGVPYLPWVAVIDPLLRAIQGVEPTQKAVADATVDFIFHEQELAYDTRYGASAYVQYGWNTYDDAVFDLTSYLSRANGSTINCTDCAAIMQAFGNMIGLPVSYTIILQNFDLNYIEAIGYDTFTHCPFGGRGCGFSYHAVTTMDDNATIYDATLALDGDDDPSNSPFTELLVQGVPGDEYLDRLVMSGRADYNYTQQGGIQ